MDKSKIEALIRWGELKREDAFRNPNVNTAIVAYWNGYIDALKELLEEI